MLKNLKKHKTIKLWHFVISLGLVLLHLKSSHITHGGPTMSLSLVKLSDNGIYCFYSKFGFFGLFSLWGSTREFVFLHQPGDTRKLHPALVYSFVLVLPAWGLLMLYLWSFCINHLKRCSLPSQTRFRWSEEDKTGFPE